MLRTWWPRLILLAALGVVVGLPLVLQPPSDATQAGDPQLRLIILSPHSAQIRSEISFAFNAWRREQGKPAIYFDWRSGGGTSDLRRGVFDAFTAAAQQQAEDQGIGYDLFFGGGDFEHNLLARGITVTRNGQQVRIPLVVPIQMPSGFLEQVYPEPTIGNDRLYHPDLLWAGVVLASFGIVYNRDVVDMLDLPEPGTWADLQDSRYRNWIALADPAHAGSIAATYNSILRRVGWMEGWGLLRRCFANARYFTASASKVPVDVSAGEAAAGLCIDFYGRYQAGSVGNDRVGYVDPPGLTSITADPIAILRGAPHHSLANEFCLWLLSKEGQRIWQRRVGLPDGPQQYELRRTPIRRDLYVPKEMIHWVDQANPFEIASPVSPGMPDFYGAVAVIAHAMAIDIHDDLKRAWTAIVEHPDHPQRQRMLELFDAMPELIDLKWPSEHLAANWQTILADPAHPDHPQAARVLGAFAGRLYQRWRDPDQILEDRLAWTLFFRDNYRQIVKMAKDGGSGMGDL